MLTFSHSLKICLVAGVTDMRCGFDGLSAIVSGSLELDPLDGSLFVFANRKRDRLKILYFERGGFWLLARRLEKGSFNWPETKLRSVEMSVEELTLLLGGIDLRKTTRRCWYEQLSKEK